MSRNIKNSPLHFIGGAIQALGAYDWGGKRKDAAIEAKGEYDAMRKKFEDREFTNLYGDVSNPYTNMQNTMEDLTVNQQQAQFEAQQGAQQRANIMQNLRGAAGASGVAGLAQAMAQQGALATQRASASIGAQESRLQFAKAQEASRLQTLEREGELKAQQARLKGAETARGLDYQKTSTLLGMAQQRTAAAKQAEAQAKAQQMEALGTIASAGSDVLSSLPG